MPILLEILLVAAVAVGVARLVPAPWRGRLLNALKAWVTVRAFWILLSHAVTLEDGSQVAAGRLVLDTLGRIDAGTFWVFCGLAAGIKFAGILASMYRWTLLLRGQGIELPFPHIFGSFLIGRFIGTFLPSTAGLDGYKLYDAARFSGKSVEVTATTALEKVMGFSGIFLSFLVALPFGIRIFGDNAGLVAALSVPICSGIIAGLLLVLWYPAVVQWGLRSVPIPGRARLESLVLRISNAAAAYRDKKPLVVAALGLSFVVHFSTAAMYYFTALAIGASRAEFWPIAFGSSIQILATVLSPFTIAGEGIREAAQYVLLGSYIGPANAIVSAALGFWAAEALTLLGAVFWWIRPGDYRPAFCLVDGRQVDYDQAARAAATLIDETPAAGSGPAAEVPPLGARLRLSAGLGLGAGVLAGLAIGASEAWLIARSGSGVEAQVLWYGPLAYALVLGGLGLAGGAVLALLPVEEGEFRGWTPSLALLGTLVPFGLAITLFRLRRDVFDEQMPPLPVLAAVLGVALAVAALLFFAGPRLFRGIGRNAVRPVVALCALALAVAAGAALGSAYAGAAPRDIPEPVPAALADAPNLILVMVDTLRADHLSCYGATRVRTPALCSLAADGQGALFEAFSQASWTKPATASLLSGLLPSSHGAVAKPSVLPEPVDLVSELLQRRGYRTGGIVSNINLAESFGFAQGYDEYHYLGPDYLAGAEESSSKLVLYSIFRALWFKLARGYRVGDFYQEAAVVNEVAFDFLERHRDARFFLFLHYMDPHDPYFAHPWNGSAVARVANQHPDPSRAAEMRGLYEGEIEYLDGHLAALLARLRELGLYENSVIVLTADHGEEFQDHGGWWHGTTLYDEQIRVPLLVKWAAGDAPLLGHHRRSLARLVDVAPTLLARAGAPLPPGLAGVDLAVDFADRAEKDRIAFAEEDHEGNVLRSVRTREWKLIEANPDNPRGLPEVELFQVARDAAERESLLDANPDLAAELRAHAEAQLQLARSSAAAPGESAELSPAQEEALRALGYLE